MTNEPDQDRVDWSPLVAHAERRAARIAAGVLDRVAAARRAEANRRALTAAVRVRLARLAVPAALAAAASIAGVLATSRRAAPRPRVFAAIILGPGPMTAWVAYDHRPGPGEIVAALGGAR